MHCVYCLVMSCLCDFPNDNVGFYVDLLLSHCLATSIPISNVLKVNAKILSSTVAICCYHH